MSRLQEVPPLRAGFGLILAAFILLTSAVQALDRAAMADPEPALLTQPSTAQTHAFCALARVTALQSRQRNLPAAASAFH